MPQAGWRDGRRDGWRDGRRDGWTDRGTDGRHGDRSSFLSLIKFHPEAAQRSIKTITASN